MNIMIKLLLLLLKSQRFCSVVVGKGLCNGWRLGSWCNGVPLRDALLFKPADTQIVLK